MKRNRFVWTTKDGRKLKLKDIGDNHLLNIQKMLKKQKKEGRTSIVGDIWGNEVDADWQDDEWTEEDQRTLKIINKEIKKRNLKEVI